MPEVHHPPRPLVAVAETLVVHPVTGDVLVVRKDGGEHALPAGGVEAGESFAQAAARETYEETGIEVEIEGLAVVTERWVGDRVELFFTFRARYLGGDPHVIDDEAVEAAMWVPLDEVDALVPWFEGDFTDLATRHPVVEYHHLVE